MIAALVQDVTVAQRLVPLAAAAAIALASIELIRRRKLREEYAILWLVASFAMLVVAVFPRLLLWFCDAVGVHYITVALILGLSFLTLVILHLAVAVSRGADDTRKMAQRIALLEKQLQDATGDQAAPSDPSDDQQ